MSPYKSQGYDPDGPDGEENSSSANSLFANRPPCEESTPMLPGRTQRKLSPDGFKFILYCLAAFAASLFVVVNLYLHLTNCPLYPSTMNDIRREWGKEEAQHELVRDEWRFEKHNHTLTLEKWELEREWHERDVARRILEENERQERVEREWAQEYERHMREVEEYEEAIARRVQEEHERQERVRKEWDQEAEQQRHEWEEMERRENQHREDERQKWRHEVENHDQMVEERRKREEEERQKLDMFWGRVAAHTCTTYATREYTAQLMNLPTTWEHRVEACKVTPLEVHGISYPPKSCEDKGPGVVIGRWEIDQHEPDCATFWNWYKDMGCTSPGSGKRRIEHYLENLPRGGDWREFCATTPARFRGLEFLGAHECFQYNSGTYGHWEIDDTSCQ